VWLHAVKEVPDVEPCGGGVGGVVGAVEVIGKFAVGLGTLGGRAIALRVIFEAPSWRGRLLMLLGRGKGMLGMW